MGLYWEPCPGGARLLRLLGDTPCPAVPGTIEGLPVAELGPYCFADRPVRPGARRTGDDTHEITGNFVEEVTLPDTVRVLDSAAFYNCRRLRRVTLGPGVEGFGSDLFTNCRQLQTFRLRAAADAPTGLKKLLGAVSADITVELDGAQLFYPEYSEFLDENTPAHIFNHSIEGEGYRYRQCFDGSVLRFAEYDAAFPQACVGESEKTLCRIALDRLCTPFALLPEAQGIYSAYLAAHAASAAAPLIARHDTESLQLVLKLADEESRRQIALACSQSGWSEGAALTLGGQRPRRQKTYDFDDL
mgnify:CR=1 FL=1